MNAPGGHRSGLALKWILGTTAVVIVAGLAWGLRSLLVPAFVGGVLAYICRPLVAALERRRIPRPLAAASLLLALGVLAIVALNSVRAAMPSEIETLELRVRALRTLHERYQALMGLDASWTRGNRLHWLAHRDLDPLMDQASHLLALTSDERAQLVSARSTFIGAERANAEALATRAHASRGGTSDAHAAAPPTPSAASATVSQSDPPALGEILSTWVVAPLIFLFLVWDTGDLKRGLVRAVPNGLFEPTLAVLADIDQALASYVRGIFFECCALGLTVTAFVTVVGVPLRWAIAIGILTGASNVVPYMGFAAALLGGLAYALLAEDIRPLLPLVTTETFVFWVLGAVVLAELLKNVVYEPIVLGGAVHLHPLVVVIGVLGGATLFGAAGMFLAIPTITVVKVLVSSGARHLVAYRLM